MDVSASMSSWWLSMSEMMLYVLVVSDNSCVSLKESALKGVKTLLVNKRGKKTK